MSSSSSVFSASPIDYAVEESSSTDALDRISTSFSGFKDLFTSHFHFIFSLITVLFCIGLLLMIAVKVIPTFTVSNTRPTLRRTTSIVSLCPTLVIPPAVPKVLPPILLSHVLVDETLESPFTFIPTTNQITRPSPHQFHNHGFDWTTYSNCSSFMGSQTNISFMYEEVGPMIPKKLFTPYKEMC